jgi:hypothetical protein
LLLAIATAIRVVIFLTYIPNLYPDTGWYLKLSEQIVHFDLSQYDGARAPGYPLVLIIGGLSRTGVWLIQLLMGIYICAIIYKIAYELTGKENVSFWIAMSYNLSLILLFFESNLLTETTCILLLILSLYYLVKIIFHGNKLRYYLILSIFLAFASLTRPVYLYLFPLFFVYLYFKDFRSKAAHGILYKKIIAYSLPFLIIILGWCEFNKVKVDYFSITSLTGFHLVEHSGKFMEYAPDKYADIRDIYLKYRSQVIEKTGKQTTTIYKAYPEIQTVYHKSISDISKELTSLSIWLFIHHPGLYFSSVLNALFDFWYMPNFGKYWDLDKIHPGFLSIIAEYYINLELFFWIIINLSFLIFLCNNVYRFFKNPSEQIYQTLTLINLSIFILSVLQALVQYGDNWRFGVSMKPFLLISVLINFVLIYKRRCPVKDSGI